MLPEIPLENINKKIIDIKENEHLQFMYCIRNLCLDYTKNSYSTIIKDSPIFKVGKGFNQHFSKEDTQVANKHMQTC